MPGSVWEPSSMMALLHKDPAGGGALLVTLGRSHTTGMKSKVHPTYKTKYRVANWPACRHYGPRWTLWSPRKGGRWCPRPNVIFGVHGKYSSTPCESGTSGRNNLHLVSYSTPVDTTMSFEALAPLLHTEPALPHAIPYRSISWPRTSTTLRTSWAPTESSLSLKEGEGRGWREGLTRSGREA